MSLQKVEFVETPGSVVRKCPGTKHHICCGYQTIDLVEGCVLSCSYCILKAYLRDDTIRVSCKPEGIIAELDKMIDERTDHILRFGTGELSDSLAIDRRYNLNRFLVDYFGHKQKAILELKSKWADFRHLLPHLNPYTVISFSVSPQRFIDAEETRTSPIHKRLKAARLAQDSGCFVGLHFDPIVIYDGFERDYRYLIADIGRMLDPARILWISLGTLRFPPALYDLLLQRRRRYLLSGEFIRGEDGKYRYIKTERIRIYRMLYRLLKDIDPNLFIYLCMERADVWQEALGIDMKDSEGLVGLFDERVKNLYGGTL
ncbi:MAG: Spore photoproduct lyase [Syntrophorhabdus sp. PtaB.Bin184]|nr:MAG: Spore photoproduct lyase [Syntrophorhabdus sp. PtaB.Bin184]